MWLKLLRLKHAPPLLPLTTIDSHAACPLAGAVLSSIGMQMSGFVFHRAITWQVQYKRTTESSLAALVFPYKMNAPPAKKSFMQRNPAPGPAESSSIATAAKQKQMADAREGLQVILSFLRFSLCHGWAERPGDDDDETNGREFVPGLVKLRVKEDIPELQAWLDREETSKWLSRDTLNEMTEIMSNDLLRMLKKETQSAEFFSVVMDEMSDFELKEQVSVCIRFVTENLETEELFVGFFERPAGQQAAEPLFQLLKNVLIRLSLPVSRCRGQCYEGVAELSDIQTGLQARMQELEPRALYAHPTAQLLDVVVQDVQANVQPCNVVMSYVRDIITMIRNSREPVTWYMEYQDKDTPELRPLCPDRFPVETASLQAILSNYDAVLDFLEDLSAKNLRPGQTVCSPFFLHYQLQEFSTFFSLHLMLKVFLCLETANAELQNQPLHFQNARQLVDTLRGDIVSLREGFQQLWENTTTAATDLDLRSPVLPRTFKCHPPRHTFQTPEEMHRHEYLQAMETLSSSLDCRFGASVLKHMQDVEDFVVGRGDCKRIMQFYGNDFDKVRLTLHRDVCLDVAKQRGVRPSTFHDIVDFLKGNQGGPFPEGDQGFQLRDLMSELTRLVRQVLTLPATQCSSERSLSGLQRVKDYVRTTRRQERITHLALMDCHKHVADEEMDLDVIADTFLSRTAARRNAFPIKKTH